MTGFESVLELNSKALTLPDFIRIQQHRHSRATGELTDVLLCIALGTKIVSRGVNRAGLASLLGLTGETNVQGEAVQKLDIYADTVFANTLGRSGEIISMVSEERETLFAADGGSRESKYVIAFDPLDGSSNIDVNVSIGTIWSIYPRKTSGARVDPKNNADFLQPGSEQIAAGYTIYGSSTMFVMCIDNQVNGFTLDPTIGEFVLTHPKMQIPKGGKTYSCNESNSHSWNPRLQRYLSWVKQDPSPDSNGADKRPYSMRYVGSLVADFHRTLLKGGLFFYPADKRRPSGKLRLLYECNPLALIAEHAGGAASTGSQPVLSLVPGDIHERTPLFIGSKEMVAEIEQFLKE